MITISLLFGVAIAYAIVSFGLRVIMLNACVRHLPRIPFSMFRSFLGTAKTSTELYQCLNKAFTMYDGMCTFWFGPKLAVVCDDPEDMKTIFMSKDCFERPYLYRMLGGLAGNGLFTAPCHVWQPDRKHINTVFTLSVLKQFEPKLNRQFCAFSKSLKKYVGQPECDLTRHVIRSNFYAVMNTNFNYDYEALEDTDNDDTLDNIAKLWELTMTRASLFILHPTFIYRMTKHYVEERKVTDALKKFAPKLVAHARERRKTEKSNQIVVNDADSDIEAVDIDDDMAKRTILIDRLLDLEENGLMTQQRVEEQINTFLVGSTDTSSFTTLNLLLLLALNLDKQDLLYEELKVNIPNPDYIDYTTLTKLDYLDRALKESMRLLTLGFVLLRETNKELPLTKCTVPAGTVLVMNFFKLHRSERTWGPNTLDFEPDRFLPDAVAQRHPFAFLPFAAGARNCIGYKYALNSMKVMICHLLLRYRFTTKMRMADLTYKFEFLLKFNNRYVFQLEKR